MRLLLFLADEGSQTPNIFNWGLLALAIALLATMLITKNSKWDKNKLAVLEIKDFISTMRKGSLIDVRKESEVEKGKIVGARNFPGSSGAGDAKVRKDLPIFLYDDTGSSKMKSIASKYIKNGAVMVYVLRGGYNAYKEYKEKNK